MEVGDRVYVEAIVVTDCDEPWAYNLSLITYDGKMSAHRLPAHLYRWYPDSAKVEPTVERPDGGQQDGDGVPPQHQAG